MNLLQMGIESINTEFFSWWDRENIQKLSLQFIECNLAHFVASDAHSCDQRPFLMQALFHTIMKLANIRMTLKHYSKMPVQ